MNEVITKKKEKSENRLLNVNASYISKREVLCLAISSSNLMASGEYGSKPAIHIWD